MSYSIGELVVELGMDITDLERTASRAGDVMQGIGNKVNNAGRSITRFGRNWSLFITAPLVAASGFAIKFAMDIERSEVAFGVFLGDAEKGKALFQDLVQFSAETPLFLDSITASAQMLLATGIEADGLVDKLRVLGNASRADADILRSLALNLGQVKAQGKLTGRELRDFGVRGVPLMQEIAKNMGITEKKVMSLVSAGSIGFDKVMRAFETMSEEGGRFHDLMGKVALTAGGKFTTALDNIRIAGASLFKSFMPALTKFLNIIIKIATVVRALPEGVKVMIVIVGSIIAIMGPIIMLVGTIVSMIGSIIINIGVMIAILPTLISTIVAIAPVAIPVMAVIIGMIIQTTILIVVVINTIVALIGKGDTMAQKYKSVLKMIGDYFTDFGIIFIRKSVYMFTFFAELLANMVRLFNTTFGILKGIFDTLVLQSKVVWQLIKLGLSASIQSMVQIALAGINLIIQGLNKISPVKTDLVTGGDFVENIQKKTDAMKKQLLKDTKLLLSGDTFEDAMLTAEFDNRNVDAFMGDLHQKVNDFATNMLNAFGVAGKALGGKGIAPETPDVGTPQPKFAGAAEQGSVDAFKTIAGSTNKVNQKIEKNTKTQVDLSRMILDKIGTVLSNDDNLKMAKI